MDDEYNKVNDSDEEREREKKNEKNETYLQIINSLFKCFSVCVCVYFHLCSLQLTHSIDNSVSVYVCVFIRCHLSDK